MISIEQIRDVIAEDFSKYEQIFGEILKSENKLINDVFSLATAHKGKQIRPTLVLLAAQLSRQITDKTLLTAAALELMHTATLIHDDVVDESPMRRSLPAVHTMYGNKVAVLMGDFALSRVLEVVARLRNVKIMSIVAEIGQGLANGELLGLEKDIEVMSEKKYFDIISGKTASLFSACCQAGAVSAGAIPRQESALKIFGEHFGLCFQMQDDILDFSDSEELGKPTMHDVREGKVTLPLIISLNRAPLYEVIDIKEKLHILQNSNTEPALQQEAEHDIKSFVLRYDGVGYARQKIEEHRRMAIDILDSFPNSKTKQALIDLLNFSVSRVN